MNDIKNTYAAAFSFSAAFIVYFITMAPTVSYWDCGEFIASSITLGIPHPPGAPLFLLIGKLFSMSPVGADAAYRVNIISVLASAFTVMLLYLIIVRLIKEFAGKPDTLEKEFSLYGGGIIGALTFAYTDTFWFNATEAEVYSLSMLFTALCIWLTLKWMENHNELRSLKYLIACSYLFGLAVGVHLLNLLIIPTIFLLVFFYDRKLAYNLLLGVFAIFIALGFIVPLVSAFISSFFGPGTPYPGAGQWFLAIVLFIIILVAQNYVEVNYKLWTVLGVLLVVGVSTYIMIYIRANLGPVINENDPSTLERFASYWNRDQYGQESLVATMFPRRADFISYQVNKMYVRYFAWNFIGKGTTLGMDRYIVEIISPKGLYFMPFLLGLTGLWYHFKRDWRRALAVMSVFIITGIAIIVYLNQPDPQPRERDYVYVGSYFAFAIWIGMSMGGLIHLAGKFLGNRSSRKTIVYGSIVGFGFLLGPALEYRHNFDSHDRRGNYMAWDYSYNILQSCDPNAIIFTNGDNDTFPLWYLQEVEGIRKDVSIVNLSLLNTDWYIKQLRDANPAVAISLTDAQIENLSYSLWEERTITYPVPAPVYNDLINDVHEIFGLQPIASDTTFSFVFKPTVIQPNGSSGIRIQDIMIEHIIRENRWRRPVYFAITVSSSNKLGLDRNLRLEGLALKLVPFPSNNIAVDDLAGKLLETFKYRGINNPDVYHNKQKKDLLQNLRFAFISIANFYAGNNMPEEAVKFLDAMEERVPADLIPFPNYQILMEMGRVYSNSGKPGKAKNLYEKVLMRDDADSQVKITVAQNYAFFLKDYKRTVELCREVLEEDPFNPNAYSLMVTILRDDKQYFEAKQYLETWILRNPNDSNAKSILNEIEGLITAADTSGSK
ncbi:DUF2723 domain-containing protein [candidate division KSB1 bacterium]|nr:DUF2723 domain-containing protein [candidate division KSB1 bacterium]